MELESIEAIHDCMEDLGFHPSEQRSFTARAKVLNLMDERKFGGIEVTFQSDWHAGDRPYIEMDDAIRGYGVPYTGFRQKWQRFKYDGNKKCWPLTEADTALHWSSERMHNTALQATSGRVAAFLG